MGESRPKENGGCEVKLPWVMKPNKTDHAGGRKLAKTVLKDDAEIVLPLAAAMWHMLSLRENQTEVE